MLLGGEMYVADGGYSDGYGYSATPNGLHDFEDRQRATARARHETINGELKVYRALRDMWRHEREKHSPVFHAVANIVQLGLREGDHAFAVDYDEAEFGDFDFGGDDDE